MKIKHILFILVLASGIVRAGIETASTTAEGYGKSYLEAVDNALVSAAQQVRGASISIARIPYKMFASESEANMMLGMGNANQKSVMVDSSASIYLKRFQGYVKSYNVTESSQLEEDSWYVKIEAEVYKEKQTALGEIKNDTIAVLPLHVRGAKVEFFGKELTAEKLTDGISAELGVQLTKSNKLDVVDREYLADIAAENRLVTSGEATFKQQVLLGLISGADYIMTGSIRDFRVGDHSRGSETLGFYNPKFEAKVTVDLRIVAVGTSKTVCADTLDVWLKHADIMAQRRDRNDYGKLDIDDQLLIITRIIAERISDKTIESVFPARVAQVIGDNVIITGGGVNVKVGDRYSIEAGNETILDPETGEVLGRFGGKKIVIKIEQVNDKMSIGKVIDGDIGLVKTGNYCTKLDPIIKENRNGRAGLIQPDKNGKVVLPGDPR